MTHSERTHCPECGTKRCPSRYSLGCSSGGYFIPVYPYLLSTNSWTIFCTGAEIERLREERSLLGQGLEDANEKVEWLRKRRQIRLEQAELIINDLVEQLTSQQAEIERLREEVQSHAQWAEKYGKTEAGKAILENKCLRTRLEEAESFCVDVWQESELSSADRYILDEVLARLRG